MSDAERLAKAAVRDARSQPDETDRMLHWDMFEPPAEISPLDCQTLDEQANDSGFYHSVRRPDGHTN